MSIPIYANVTIPVTNGTTSSGKLHISTAGTNGSTWNTIADIKPAGIHVNGDAVFHGNITWQGRDMREWFASIESRLSILQPNPQLEENFHRLKELGNQYRALEKELLEQQRTFDILKKKLD